MGCQPSELLKKQPFDKQSDRIDIKTSSYLKKYQKKRNKFSRIDWKNSEDEIYENIQQVLVQKTEQDIKYIIQIINKHFLLSKLTFNQQFSFANAMKSYTTQEGQYIFKQNSIATRFFVINEGKVVIEINNQPLNTLRKGDFFGQLALLTSAPRCASVKAIEKCHFWCLGKNQFVNIRKNITQYNYNNCKTILNNLPEFQFLSKKQKESISFNMFPLQYKGNQYIFNKDDAAQYLFLIKEGKVEINVPNHEILQLGQGDYFGQNSLKQDRKRYGAARCVVDTKLLAINREILKMCLGCKAAENRLYFNIIIKWSLKRSIFFKKLNSQEQQKLIGFGTIQLLQDKTIIISQGQNDECIYICLQGNINNYKVGQVINEQQYKKSDLLLFLAKETLIKEQKGHIFKIKMKYIEQLLKNTLERQNSYNFFIQNLEQESQKGKALMINNANLQFKDFVIITKLSEGMLSQIFLVQNNKTKIRYVLKVVAKEKIIKNKLQKFIRSEKQVQALCSFPFIVQLFKTYKDTHFIYFLIQYIQGGDFFQFLNELGYCNNTTAKFYFGCFLLCIEYLHKKSIVYRDLRPENATIDKNGYLHMIDMGTAKLLVEQDQISYRTFTIIGTPHYMAPQIFQAKGYSFSVDIWSLGIILYEMVCGYLPFGSQTNDPVEIYQQILKNQLIFPQKYTNQQGKQLIKRLLERNSEIRAVGDFSQIKNMKYFKNFDWSMLQSMKMKSPARSTKSNDYPKQKTQNLSIFFQKYKKILERPVNNKDSDWDDIF